MYGQGNNPDIICIRIMLFYRYFFIIVKWLSSYLNNFNCHVTFLRVQILNTRHSQILRGHIFTYLFASCFNSQSWRHFYLQVQQTHIIQVYYLYVIWPYAWITCSFDTYFYSMSVIKNANVIVCYIVSLVCCELGNIAGILARK